MILLIECEGLHGVARPLRMLVDFHRDLDEMVLRSIVDQISADICREVEHVKGTLASFQELTQDADVVHASIGIIFSGQETPSNELNIRFVKLDGVNDWPINKRETRIVREIMDISKEFTK